MHYACINELFLMIWLEFATFSERSFGGIAKQGGVRRYNKNLKVLQKLHICKIFLFFPCVYAFFSLPLHPKCDVSHYIVLLFFLL